MREIFEKIQLSNISSDTNVVGITDITDICLQWQNLTAIMGKMF